MRRHPGSPDVQMRGCRVLFHLCNSSSFDTGCNEVPLMLMDAGAMVLVGDALSTHAGHAGVLDEAKLVLEVLNHEASKRRQTKQEAVQWQTSVWDKVSRIVSPSHTPRGSQQGSHRGSQQGSRDGSPAPGSQRTSRTSLGHVIRDATPASVPSPSQGSPERPPRPPGHHRLPSADTTPRIGASEGTISAGSMQVSVQALEDAERRAQAMGQRASDADRRALEANKRALASDERAAKAEQRVAELQAALAESKFGRGPSAEGGGACEACSVQ